VAGDKKTCLDYVGKVWTDMRPKSLRVWMEEHAKQTAAGEPTETETSDEAPPPSTTVTSSDAPTQGA
jgi:MbtH protein